MEVDVKLLKFFFSWSIILFLVFPISFLKAEGNENWDFLFKPSSQLFVDINQIGKVEFAAEYKGQTPNKLELALLGEDTLKFFRWNVEWRNTRVSMNRIYNSFWITTDLDSLKKWRTMTNCALRPGVHDLEFQVIATFDESPKDTLTIFYQVIIKPAILSIHEEARGIQNVIEWIDSDLLKFSFVNINDTTKNGIVDPQLPNFAKSLGNNIKTTRFDGLTKNHVYQYFIEGYSPDNIKVVSNNKFIEQDGILPPSVQNVKSQSAPDGEIRLMWDYEYDSNEDYDLIGFIIFRKESVTDTENFSNLTAIDTLFIDEERGRLLQKGEILSFQYMDSAGDLENGKYYFYRVSAIDKVHNFSVNGLTNRSLSDNIPPSKPVFEWDENSYDWRDTDPSKDWKNQEYRFGYFKSGNIIVVKLNDPHVNVFNNTLLADSFRIQWVRDFSNFFKNPDPSFFGSFNVSDTPNWKSINDSRLNGFLVDTLDFSLNGIVSPDSIHGHLYKYRAQFRDAAGNLSPWSREFRSEYPDSNLIGAKQDLFPPEPVTILQAVVNTDKENNEGNVNLQWITRDDLVSGLDYMIVKRSKHGIETEVTKIDFEKNIFDYQTTDAIIDLDTDTIPKATTATYWIESFDHVGNSIAGVQKNIKFKVGPKINYVEERKKFQDEFKFTIQYDSDIPLDGIEVFIDCSQDGIFECDSLLEITETPINRIVHYPIDGIDGDNFTLFVRARFADGDISLNSKQLCPVIDILIGKPEWIVLNDSSQIEQTITENFTNYPTIKIFSLDNDIDYIYISPISNVTDNSHISNLGYYFNDAVESTHNFSGMVKYNLIDSLREGETLVFQDTSKYPLEFFDYQLTIVDSAGNEWTSTQSKSGFGVIQPKFTITKYDKIAEEIHFELKYHKNLYDADINLRKADFRLRRFLDFYDPDSVDIDTVDSQFPDRRGPHENDTVSSDGDSVIIRGVWKNVSPQENGIRKKYFVYALLCWRDEIRHTRAGCDSVDASIKIDLQNPIPKLIDQPEFGRIWIDWTFADDDNGVRPDTFRVHRDFKNYTKETDSAYMDEYASLEKRQITYIIEPGLKLLKGEVYWSPIDAGETTIWDTRRAFIPFLGFPTDEPKKYIPINNQTISDHDSVFVNSDTLTICWYWDSTKPNSENNKETDVGQILIQVDDNSNFSSPLDTTISDKNLILDNKFNIPAFHTRRELDFPTYGDTIYVRLTAKDIHLHEPFIFLPDIALAIIDDQPPDPPSTIVNFPSPGFNADITHVNMNIHWSSPSDISGIKKYIITCENLFEQDVTFELLPDKNKEKTDKPPMYLWYIADTDVDRKLYLDWDIGKEHKVLNRLMLINVEYKDNSKVQISIEDNLGNTRNKSFDKSDFLFPVKLDPPFTLEMKVIGSDTLLSWNSIQSPDLREDFSEYFINYIDALHLLGWPLSNPIHITSVDETIYNINGKTNNYFHILARFQSGNLTTVTRWSNVVSKADIPASNSELSGVLDNLDIIPEEFKLHQNYPNPFNPTTSITYDLPIQDHVTIKIYDVFGREIKTLIDKELPVGRYQAIWDGKNFRQIIVSSGIYFIVYQTKEFISRKKCILVK